MWRRNPPQTHHIRSTMLEEKPKRGSRELLNKGILKSIKNYFEFGLSKCQSWPERRENYFFSEGLETKIGSSNFPREQKEQWYGENWYECERPRYWIKDHDQIPDRRSFFWILREPVVRKIGGPRGTGGHSPPAVVTAVVVWSDNVRLISLNLINYLCQSSV